ncbi:hypothetical protein [Bacteroides sp.]|nr:hypothetical protein [Bacteroides sp.]
MESNFTGVVTSDVTENENIGREIRADDIKTMSLDGKIWDSPPINSD